MAIVVPNRGIVLPDHRLKSLINQQHLRIEPYDATSINPTSIDLKLGPILVRYKSPQTINLGSPEAQPEIEEIDVTNSTYTLQPGEFILGMTKETVSIPNGYQGFIETKGNVARAGIQVHNGDGHIDPGFEGTITLEISNMHRTANISILLQPNIFICQLFISKLESECEFPYNGKYFKQTRPTPFVP